MQSHRSTTTPSTSERPTAASGRQPTAGRPGRRSPISFHRCRSAPTRVAAFTIQAAGSGYAVDDVITVEGGTAETLAVLGVTSVNGTGAVTGLQLFDGGEYTVQPANPAVTSTSGAGTGLTLNLTFEQ